MSAVSINHNNFRNEVIKSAKSVLLDARTPQEYREGGSPEAKMFRCRPLTKWKM